VTERMDAVSGVGRKLSRAGRLMRHEGPSGVAARVLRRMSERVAPPSHMLNVFREDVVAAAETGGARPAALPALPGEPLTVAWVMTPPYEGSGGHTTLLRMVGALEQAGHRCVLYLYDRWGGDLDDHARVLRTWWPWVRAEVRDAAAGIDDSHAVIATAWPTAYAVAAAPAKGTRFYLVQDFEPWFFPAGGEALLAEATYRFGFHGITAGRWLAGKLSADYGMPADHFDFGCDLEHYRREDADDGAGPRTGVCFFARRITPRRAFDLGALALELFAARHPGVDIHFYGDPVGRMPFPAVDHGVMTPAELGRLYNRCAAGLVLSATNVSLVPHEMLAAGCIPVVNDAEHNRVVLDNAHIAYAPATPFELADALCALVDRPLGERGDAARAAAASVQGSSWDQAGAAVERIVRQVVEDAVRPPRALLAS
jgi:glycosyltransferase involved in cell wall biosynthesis